MADPNQLALLKRSVAEWNAWRKANPGVEVDLRGADLRQIDLSGADLHDADLSRANLIGAIFVGANLGEANLLDANFIGDDIIKAHIGGASFKEIGLVGLSFIEATPSELQGLFPNIHSPEDPKLVPHPTQPSSTTDWLNLVETVGSNLIVTSVTLASIIQGLDVVERRWREHQEKHKQQGTQTPQPALASSPQLAASPSKKTPASHKEIVEILLVMDDGSQHGFKRWVSEPDALKTYIDAFSDPTSTVKPRQVVFRKLGGRALVVDVTKGGKDNKQLNVILGYLDADPL